MNPQSTLLDEVYDQDTDLQFISLLLRYLKTPVFLDVGAEKGGFAKALFNMGFHKGILFEPLPSHLEHLETQFANTSATILAYAIDREDRTASFNIACDEHGRELNYFHSLNKIADHKYFQHSKVVEARCRSLDSLLASSEIPPEVGVLKIDTEGNDLRVLEGIGALRPEVVVCEFVPPAVYPDWQLSFADKLIPEARKLGYTHVIAIQRTDGSDKETVRLDPPGFTPNDWGNLVFIREDLFSQAADDLIKFIRNHGDRFVAGAAVPVMHDVRYNSAFQSWLGSQLRGFSRQPQRSVAVDVGAHEGEFFKSLLDQNLVSKLVMFEPHPTNALRLRESMKHASVTLEECAVGASAGIVDFRFGGDSATGSVLSPTGHTPAATQSKQVPMVRLDDYAREHGLLDKVNVLKIDTQGSDLAVLEGAETLLAESRPLLVVELIFAPLYERQGDPVAIIAWLASRGYRLAGFFDEHFSREGWLAWTDACFMPVSRMSGYQPPFVLRQSVTDSPGQAQGASNRRKHRGLSGLMRKLRGK